MQRRRLLRGIAASSALSITAGVAAGQGDREVVHLSEVDVEEAEVRRDGEVVRTLSDPSPVELSQELLELDDDERLTSDDYCFACCPGGCPCKPCGVACFDCICSECDCAC